MRTSDQMVENRDNAKIALFRTIVLPSSPRHRTRAWTLSNCARASIDGDLDATILKDFDLVFDNTIWIPTFEHDRR